MRRWIFPKFFRHNTIREKVMMEVHIFQYLFCLLIMSRLYKMNHTECSGDKKRRRPTVRILYFSPAIHCIVWLLCELNSTKIWLSSDLQSCYTLFHFLSRIWPYPFLASLPPSLSLGFLDFLDFWSPFFNFIFYDFHSLSMVFFNNKENIHRFDFSK